MGLVSPLFVNPLFGLLSSCIGFDDALCFKCVSTPISILCWAKVLIEMLQLYSYTYIRRCRVGYMSRGLS